MASTVRFKDKKAVLTARRLASQIEGRWQAGEVPDLSVVLRENPELHQCKSVVLDLAYEEYRLRLQAGETLEAKQFSRRFPTLYTSLYVLIEVREFLNKDPDYHALMQRVPWPEPGDPLLDFSLIAELGRGAFSRVFLASQSALGDRLVVLKITPQEGREAKILGKLSHPNIVPVHSVQNDEATGLTVVCLPYLGRATLADVLDHAFAGESPPTSARTVLDAIAAVEEPDQPSAPTALPSIPRGRSYVEGIVDLVAQLADALAFTHSRGICHRDLKPSNVLMSRTGRPLLMDFNLSSDEELHLGRIGGTLPYMAPEQLRSVVTPECDEEYAPADPRSDLYSLGVVLYELLGGAHPFQDLPWKESLEEIGGHLLEAQRAGPRSLQEVNPRVDGRVARLVGKCLAFDPADRPQTAAALATDLRRELRPMRRWKRRARNHPVRSLLVTALLVALIVGVGAAFALRAPYSVRQSRLGRQHFQHGEYEQAVEHLNEAIRVDPEDSKSRLARGQAFHKLGDFVAAGAEYRVAYRLAPDPTILACRAYCAAKLDAGRVAIALSHQAMQQGYDSAALSNNMAFCHIQLAQLDEAEACLKRALEYDPALQTAHHNLVRVSLVRSARERSVSEESLQHARRAVTVGEPSALLYHETALLFALGARDDPRLIPSVVEYLQEAVRHGLDPKSFAEDVVLLPLLRENEDFQALIAGPSPSRPAITPDYFVDPL